MTNTAQRDAYGPPRAAVGTVEASKPVLSESEPKSEPPLIAHLIYRLDMGGLENGLVNLINRIPPSRYRHAIICLTDYTDFRQRILREDVEIFALHKRPGHDLGSYFRLWRLLRRIRPDLIHTRNLAALEGVLPAALAGVPCRVHGEHGRDVGDVDGSSLRYRLLRRALSPLVHRFVALSFELQQYLLNSVGIRPEKVTAICNGVDTERFRPYLGARATLPVAGFAPASAFVIGTVGRMEAVKDPVTLARAFVRLLNVPQARERL
ncbi:MAG TPA: glycosyltransferase, partial [Thermoleophilia bacterium]|nr:glycosyltransferase [Thermoleophilia bacterium]